MTRLLLILLASFFISSCGGDDDVLDCNASTFMTEVSDEIDALNQAGSAYATDPSQANCDAFKAAAQNYLTAVEAFSDCDGITQQQFDTELAAARQAVDSIPC